MTSLTIGPGDSDQLEATDAGSRIDSGPKQRNSGATTGQGHVFGRLLMGLVVVCLSATPVAADFKIFEATIDEINRALDEDRLTSEQLVQYYLERIDAFEDEGPGINALITVNPKALERARALDRERAKKGPRSVLHGIPVILKESYDTADLPTTAGSVALKGSQPAKDGYIVKRLRSAGAVVIGKANMSEFALSQGWFGYSSLGGLTRNPYNLKRNASGSSSGSAAAVSSNFAVIATGTDTAGSVRAPAAVTGVVGIKPTLGLTSRNGIVPAALSFDVAGPIARTVKDAAIALGFMTGVDQGDPRTEVSRGRYPEDYTGSLSRHALKGVRLGVARQFLGGNPEVDEVFEKALSKLEEKGAVLLEVQLPEFLLSLWDMMDPVIDAEFRPQIEAYLAGLSAGRALTLADIIAISESPAVKDSKTPLNPARITAFKEAQASRGLADTGYLYLVSNEIPRARSTLRGILEENRLGAIVLPTVPCPASPVFDEDDPEYVCNVSDPYTGCYLASLTGFPEISVPAGLTGDGMPVGISFLGVPFGEPTLLGFAYAFEQATRARRPPRHTPRLH